MVESNPDDPSLTDRIRSNARQLRGADEISLSRRSTRNDASAPAGSTTDGSGRVQANATGNNVAEDASTALPPPAPPPAHDGDGATSSTIGSDQKQPNFAKRFYNTGKDILLSSYINILLVFVPVGIVTNFTGVSPTLVFVANAIAIVPLAGLLSHATESVAASMGDTMGALLNVSFGNAVELIIFIIALVKNEIAIVQASLLGSILANLLLILGMSFAIGGLRYREQIYNSTVTQMSACLLSLSVTSLLLPTAFHASFSDSALADTAVLKVSRGTSVILLIVYVLYLLFQLKSHAYMYESMPQHVIDEESHPGLLADMLNSSSSSDTTGSSSDTDSDGSSGSHTTAKRIRRALRGRRRRKSNASSKGTGSPSTVGASTIFNDAINDSAHNNAHRLGAILSGDEADNEQDLTSPITVRDFENEKHVAGSKTPEAHPKKKMKRKQQRRQRREEKRARRLEKIEDEDNIAPPLAPTISFADDLDVGTVNTQKRLFNIRGLSVRPAMPMGFLSTTVFSAANPTGPLATGTPPTAVPRAPYGLRRTNSLPDRLNKARTQSSPQTGPPQPVLAVRASTLSLSSETGHKNKKHISVTSAVVLLLISTGLVAVCAEFLVSSINYLVTSTGISQTFIGLIILPIVGNAAEHVTAVTVASKNKMDLAIGVAVGSSIQIALFVTPVVVLLGWILNKDMSLYFSLFETISLFVSAFIVNFLVLDGRSNYLEGTLLMAAYVIIAVAAFFYPNGDQQSLVGGSSGGHRY